MTSVRHGSILSENETDVAHYNFDAHQPILVMFGRDVAERGCYQMVICNIQPLLMSLRYLGKHEPRKLCLFSHSIYRVSKTTLLSEHAVDFVFFSDEKMFTIASPVNLQNDRIYAPSNSKLLDTLLNACCVVGQRSPRRCWCTLLSQNWDALAVLRRTGGESGWQIGYYREGLLKKQMLPVMRRIAGDTYTCFSRAAHRRTVLARQFSCCSRRHYNLSPRYVAY